MTEKLYSMEATRNLLGCLLNNPKVLLTSKFKFNITREDFKPCLVHLRLFAVIENLVAEGASEIDSFMVSQYVEPYEEVVELFKDNNTFEFVDVIKTIVNADNIEIYYNKVKKLSALRDYRDSGFNIDEFFDVTKDEEAEMGKLDKAGLDEIIAYYDGLNTQVKRKYSKLDGATEFVPDVDELKSMIQGFKEIPLQGSCLQSPYITTLTNGALRGYLFLRAGNSGSGKTTTTIGDICYLAATELYNTETCQWETNMNRQGGALHIHSESDTKTEVSVIYLAFISGVERNKITKGLMNEEEEERVLRATEILVESEIFFNYDPKFTVPSIRESIKEFKERHNIHSVFFDYLTNNGSLAEEMINRYKNYIPDHQVLLYATEELKHIAEEHDVFIITGMQLNDSIKTCTFADEGVLASSKAVKNKLDSGWVQTFITPKEMKCIEPFLDKRGFKNHLKPNRCSHVFKGRFNDTGYDKVKVFQHVNLATGRIVDICCTDEHNNFITINRTVRQS